MGHAVIAPFALDWEPMRREAPEWFRDAKFGLFFHWGPYSVPAFQNEWYSRNMYCRGLEQHAHHVARYGQLAEFGYKDFMPMMTGKRFDPEEWAELTVRAGARYAGPVTEHADNFSMWNSRVNPVNCVNLGPKRDVTAEVAAALRRKDVRVLATFHHQWLWGWFMSTDTEADVYDPANERYYGPALPLETNRYLPWRLPDEAFCRTWAQKVREVVELVDPDMIYFDSRTHIISEAARHALVQDWYGGAVAADRIISGKQCDFPVGVVVPDLERGLFPAIQPFAWQTDDRLEDRTTWCHVEGAAYRPADRIIHQLCDVVSKNGNLLLNVGPKADGSFPEEAVRVLHRVGDWLRRNGRAIYGTRPHEVFGEGGGVLENQHFDVEDIIAQTETGLFGEKARDGLAWGDFRFTACGRSVFAIAMGAPRSNELHVRHLTAMHRRVGEVRLLDGGAPVSWRQDETGLHVVCDGSWKDDIANVLEIQLL